MSYGYTGMRLVVLVMMVMSLTDLADGECYFPREWRGQWFQSGPGVVTIRESGFSTKGQCLEQQRDYYILENRRANCHQCLLIIQRHHNIIQYKESYCVGPDTLRNLCTQIRVEAILFTLVREPAIPVPSPFNDAFYFSYNNNSGGLCLNNDNYAQQCASAAKFQFQFHKCNPLYVAYTSERELEFECLATWKDGSDHYMYGGFTGPGITDKNQQYRCFMYQVLGTVVYLAVSADATCRGLRNPRDGPLTLELTADMYGWPVAACPFPDWLTRTSWRDLSGRHIYTFDRYGQSMTLTYRRRTHALGHVTHAYRCMHTTSERTKDGTETATVLSYTSDDCEAKRQCIQITKKRDNLVEIYRGNYIEGEPTRCLPEHLGTFISKHVLIPEYQQPVPCPYSGQYFVQEDSHCHIDMRSGCNNTSLIHFHSTCVTQPVGALECVETWEQRDKQYVIIRNIESVRSAANCFSFRRIGSEIEFAADPHCNHGTPQITPRLSYMFKTPPQPCSRLQSTKSPIQSRSQDTGGGGPAGGYQHPEQPDIIVDTVQQHHAEQADQPQVGDKTWSSSLSSSAGSSRAHHGLLLLWVSSVIVFLVRR